MKLYKLTRNVVLVDHVRSISLWSLNNLYRRYYDLGKTTHPIGESYLYCYTDKESVLWALPTEISEPDAVAYLNRAYTAFEGEGETVDIPVRMQDSHETKDIERFWHSMAQGNYWGSIPLGECVLAKSFTPTRVIPFVEFQ